MGMGGCRERENQFPDISCFFALGDSLLKKSCRYRLSEATRVPKPGAAPLHVTTYATKGELELWLNLSLARILCDPSRT